MEKYQENMMFFHQHTFILCLRVHKPNHLLLILVLSYF